MQPRERPTRVAQNLQSFSKGSIFSTKTQDWISHECKSENHHKQEGDKQNSFHDTHLYLSDMYLIAVIINI